MQQAQRLRVPVTSGKHQRALDWLNFSVADVQTGVGPFLAAVLTAKGWNPAQIGTFLTCGGLLGVVLQGPAGALVDATRHKRGLIAAGISCVVAASLLLAFGRGFLSVATAQLLLSSAGPFIAPAITAITLGLVGRSAFGKRLGRNHGFDSAGNFCAAALMGLIGWRFGLSIIFLVVPLLSVPAFLALNAIPAREIDHSRARGGSEQQADSAPSKLKILLRDRVLVGFAAAVFLFHFANAAMLPQLGEMLARGRPRSAAPFMSATVFVTQLVIALTASAFGNLSAKWGPRPLLLFGFGVLPVRGVLYGLTNSVSLLIAIQVLDGVANSIFGVASAVLVADRVRGSGHFNLAMGGLATVVGIGAALSNGLAGLVTQAAGFRASFFALASIAVLAFLCLLLFVPDSHKLQARLPTRAALGEV
ncbi:MAG: MFS transporter [Acidobacteriaceae bacterium]|nr:MFS transporter [Acidobacteriaceae bacterium]